MSDIIVFVIAVIALILLFPFIRKKEDFNSNEPQSTKQDYLKSNYRSSNYRDKPYISPSKTTLEAQALYYALKDRGLPVELERYDGYKTIDISIPSAKINIEVDGTHHNLSSEQALADLKRTYYSFLEGYYT